MMAAAVYSTYVYTCISFHKTRTSVSLNCNIKKDQSHFTFSAMALRNGFVRYAFSIQYHGSSFLGFGYLGKQEDSVLADGTDLRGYRSVEARLREAFGVMIGDEQYENIKVSSRTDRGVHALKNTCHVDILRRPNGTAWDADTLRKGLNHHLSQQGAEFLRQQKITSEENATERYVYRRARRKMDSWSFHYPMNELRILKCIQAPLTMKNKFKTADNDQPEEVDWNVRFSANQRTYIYRVLATDSTSVDWALPFEWDRSWRVLLPTSDREIKLSERSNRFRGEIDINSMKDAACYLLGERDFSSFRASGCGRASPIVTMYDIQIASQAYGQPALWEGTGGLLGIGDKKSAYPLPQLIVMKFVGSSFMYHQVRNMVGALVAVGQGCITPTRLREILNAKDRTIAPAMAPAHGLFLADVQHDGVRL